MGDRRVEGRPDLGPGDSRANAAGLVAIARKARRFSSGERDQPAAGQAQRARRRQGGPSRRGLISGFQVALSTGLKSSLRPLAWRAPNGLIRRVS